MNTLGNKTQRKIAKSESYSIHEGFICKDKVVQGEFVKLNSDGTVSKVTGKSDVPFGMVYAGCHHENGDVTIQTQFNAIVIGVAGGSLQAGDEVAVNGSKEDAGDTFSIYEKSSDNVVGVALATASTNDLVRVGIYRMFKK